MRIKSTYIFLILILLLAGWDSYLTSKVHHNETITHALAVITMITNNQAKQFLDEYGDVSQVKDKGVKVMLQDRLLHNQYQKQKIQMNTGYETSEVPA